MPGSLYVVATPIGNLEDITLRALRVLREAAIIAAEDTRRTAKLLSHYSISTPTTSVHEHNETRRIESLLDRLAAGDDVALVSDAGTPGVSDPGRHVVAAALARGFKVVAIPGPSAVIAALVSSGFETDSFLFAGFPPRRSKAREEWLRSLARQPNTAVFFEAPHRILETLAAAEPIFGNRPIVVARELSKIHEQLVIGPISKVRPALSEPRGEYTIVLSQSIAGPQAPQALPKAQQLLGEFGQLTESAALTRRQALSELARKYQMPQRQLYDAIEKAKKSVS